MGKQIILTINSGSSSCKAAVFTISPEYPQTLELIANTTIHAENPLPAVQEWLQTIANDLDIFAIGHRFVHGGTLYSSPQLITPEILSSLDSLQIFDPLHAQPATQLIRKSLELYPDIPQVACFDTSFFADMPRLAKLIALPEALREAGVQRYGFHGLSYTYVQREFEQVAGTVAKNGRVIYAHLGSGSSLTATRNGAVIDTTMGFSPASGIPSSTRSGDVDPTIAGFLHQIQGINPDEFADIAQTKSGLLAISGSSGDMKQLLATESEDSRGAEAVSFYVYNVQKAIGGLAATIGGVDSLVFTGGIGEESDIIRNRICEGLPYLGIELDHDRNSRHDFAISADHSSAGVHVIQTNEALIIAEQTKEIGL